MGMWKCVDTVKVSSLFGEAREVGFPLRLLWQLVTSYKMPRAVKAFGSISYMREVEQGILPGCTHATTLLTVLVIRTLISAHEICPTVHPRALVDDCTLQW
eukprot:7027507-Pyramimonas_sp.AAC.1